MSWRDGLLPASFRGVPFFFQDTEGEGGRRPVNHEFPLRDDAYVEDMGKQNRKYVIAGYVLGDDYFAARDNLFAALESSEGPGTLSHPYLGPLTVNVDKFRWREIREEGGCCRFEMTFLDSGSNPSPVSSEDTASESYEAADDLDDQLEQSFEDDWSIDGGSLEDALALLGELTDALALLISWPGLLTDEIAALVGDLADLVADGAALAGALVGFFDGYSALVVSFATDNLFDETLSSRGPLPVADPSYGLATLATWGGTLDDAGSGHAAVNQAALVALVQGASTAALAKLYAQTEFAAQDDADAARDQLTGLIDGLSLTAADAGDNDAYAAYQTLYRAAGDDLTERGKKLSGTVTYSFNAAMPALMLAWRLYGDAGRAGELIARNTAPHPLFMPAVVEALTS